MVNERDNTSCCCGPTSCGSEGREVNIYDPNPYWEIGSVATPASSVAIVATTLTLKDTLGSWKARWGIGRMDYAVRPGLYAVGQPDSHSPVLATANYKLTFDKVRHELTGLNVWLLVLDTKGINVWCAAGKGTFGTHELVNKIHEVGLGHIVSHRHIIVPQLGAPGIAAHEVLKLCGFRVVYGPVRASDIKPFLQSGMKATPQMRQVEFTWLDRLVLIPVELTVVLQYIIPLIVLAVVLQTFGLSMALAAMSFAATGAILVGTIFVPLLLPFIPGRAFALKGWLAGLLYSLALINLLPLTGLWLQLAYCLILPPLAAFVALNFTGASTYTSLSGVEREVKVAVPTIITSLAAGSVVFLLSMIR